MATYNILDLLLVIVRNDEYRDLQGPYVQTLESGFYLDLPFGMFEVLRTQNTITVYETVNGNELGESDFSEDAILALSKVILDHSCSA